MCSCADINECTSNTDSCDQICSNTLGGFNCGCNSGYQLASNGRTCNGEKDSFIPITINCSVVNCMINIVFVSP